jgi:cell division protein FtsL
MKYIYLLTFIILSSCGVVKKSSEESVLKDNSTTEIDLTKYSNSYTLEPLDLSKPILLGKDTIYNTRVIYNNTKEIVKEKKANNIEFKEEKKTKEVDYSETIKILGNRLIIALVVLFVLSAVLKKFTF